MWAAAQGDGHPAEYRWRPLFDATVWLTPTTGLQCSNAAKMRNPSKLAGVPQTTEPISAATGPKVTILWGHVEEILLLNKFFPTIDICLSAKIHPDKFVRWCAVGEFLAIFCILYFQRATCSTYTCILNSHSGHITCGSMVDIQSLTAEINWGKIKKKERRNHRMKI